MTDCYDCTTHGHTGYRDHEHTEPCPTCMGSGELPRTCTCDPLSNTGGGHSPSCPDYEVECTCYEMTGGHQSMCPYGVMLLQKKGGKADG